MNPFPFMITMIIFLNLLILAKTDLNCYTEYNDCFNCSVCGDDSSTTCNCNWDTDSKICRSGIPKSLEYQFFDYFDSCTDSNSIEIIQKYCGNTVLELNDKNEIIIDIPKNGEFYGTKKLYCEYIYKPPDNSDKYYTINYEVSSNNMNYIYIFLDISFYDQTPITGYLSHKNMKRDFNNIKELKLLVYFSKGLTSVPFNFKITGVSDIAKSALYITICVIILACLLCGIAIYCLSKKITKNTRLRQRDLIILALARQRENHRTEEGASSGSSEVDIEEENRKKIDILFKTTLAPKKFNKKYGIKDGNTCTICIEDFNEKKSKVSITPCKHVFHYKCLSNWLVQNAVNPKCPNCNYNLLQDFDKKKKDELQVIDVERKNNQNLNTGRNITNNNNQNLNSNENRLITINANNRSSRRRITTNNSQNHNHNLVENGGNLNEIEEIDIQNN